MRIRGDASHGPENAGGAIREEDLTEGDAETTLWKARRARVTTLKSMGPVRDDAREPAKPAIAIEYAAPASTVSTPAVPIAYSPAPAPRAPSAPPAKFDAPRRRLPRSWPVVATLAVAAGGFTYVAAVPKPAAVPPRAAATPPQTMATTSDPLHALRVQVTISPGHATATLDGKPLGVAGSIDEQLDVACPRGHHELQVEARNHRSVTKRLPCSGMVVLDVALDEID